MGSVDRSMEEALYSSKELLTLFELSRRKVRLSSRERGEHFLTRVSERRMRMVPELWAPVDIVQRFNALLFFA
jgi:hypothetical protein